MATTDNLKVALNVNKAALDRDWTRFKDGHADSVLVYSPLTPEPTKGVEAHTDTVRALLSAFPDFDMRMDRCFGQDDWVCTEFTMTGTHKAPLKGPNGQVIPPTNRKLRLALCSVVRFENGKMAEEHTYYDRVSMMSQLGIAPK